MFYCKKFLLTVCGDLELFAFYFQLYLIKKLQLQFELILLLFIIPKNLANLPLVAFKYII